MFSNYLRKQPELPIENKSSNKQKHNQTSKKFIASDVTGAHIQSNLDNSLTYIEVVILTTQLCVEASDIAQNILHNFRVD